MTLDEDLHAIRHKLDAMNDSTGDTAFDERERRVLIDALGHTQQRRAVGATLASDNTGKPSVQRELDFFLVCLGWALAVFALLVSINWSGEHPLGGAGTFGIAFLAGLCATALRAAYIGAWNASRFWQGVALLVLIVAAVALIVAGAIGAALGMAVGAAVFHALIRNRTARRLDTISVS